MVPFNKDIRQLAAANDFFQKEVYRDKNVQIVLMSIPAGEDIGEETHRADQTTIFVEGDGQAVIDGNGAKVSPDHLIVIPQGAKHNIINKGTGALKLGADVITSHSVDYSGSIPVQDETIDDTTKSNASGNQNGVLDTGDVGSSVGRTFTNRVSQTVKEGRLDFGWDLGGGSREVDKQAKHSHQGQKKAGGGPPEGNHRGQHGWRCGE